MDTFFSRIDFLLSQNRISQRQMCFNIGITPQSYSNYKFRGNCPPADCAVKIAQFLNTTVEYLVSGEEPTADYSKLNKIKNLLSPQEVEYNINPKHFWSIVKTKCKENKITQKELSSAIGLHPRNLDAKIFNNIEPSLSLAITIANYFNCSLYSLLQNTDISDNAFYKEQVETIKSIIEQ